MNKKQNFFIGAALAAGLVGTLTSLLAPRRINKGWASHAKAASERMLENREKSNKNWMLGSIAGGLVGVTTALLFAPKSGKNLMKDLAEPFQHKKEVIAKTAKKVINKAKSKSKVNEHSSHSVHSEAHSPSRETGIKSKKVSSAKKKTSKHETTGHKEKEAERDH